MAKPIGMVASMREANLAIASAYGSTYEGLIKAVVDAEDLIAFLRDADCNCREATEFYDAHTCRRCELLARVSGGAK